MGVKAVVFLPVAPDHGVAAVHSASGAVRELWRVVAQQRCLQCTGSGVFITAVCPVRPMWAPTNVSRRSGISRSACVDHTGETAGEAA